MPLPSVLLIVLSAWSPPLTAWQCPDGSPPPCRRGAAPAAVAPFSFAVLAFESRSRDSADLYLTEGFLAAELARLERQ